MRPGPFLLPTPQLGVAVSRHAWTLRHSLPTCGNPLKVSNSAMHPRGDPGIIGREFRLPGYNRMDKNRGIQTTRNHLAVKTYSSPFEVAVKLEITLPHPCYFISADNTLSRRIIQNQESIRRLHAFSLLSKRLRPHSWEESVRSALSGVCYPHQQRNWSNFSKISLNCAPDGYNVTGTHLATIHGDRLEITTGGCSQPT